MPHAVESFLKVNEVVEELALVWQLFLNDDSAVEDLFHFAPPSFESSILFNLQFCNNKVAQKRQGCRTRS
ncbi:hypothetical protein DPMN_169444 [Dreissena polymorpha]|uniref:Uncharacterized protein n=1 Tax=Dreissena polymorpha TaxID=45954 RepID=A0A9D4IDD9_DREPO|nr:hypothetical protein DPMN_169444 [Dreissena polymorpha]